MSARAALILCLSTCAAFAQTDRGTITGTISDPAGAVVANALIHARNQATGGEYDVVSTATGNYTLAELPVGAYEITVMVPGFKTFIRQGLRTRLTRRCGLMERPRTLKSF